LVKQQRLDQKEKTGGNKSRIKEVFREISFSIPAVFVRGH
jgi:hypothetical protein